MPFMPKDWVTVGAWRKYELRVIRRAWKEINLATFICALLGSGTGYGLQYLKGLKGAYDTFLVASLMIAGATAGFLAHFLMLLLSAPATLAAEDEAKAAQLNAEVTALKKKTEEERNLVRRRGSGPLLKPIDDDWVRLFIRTRPGQYAILHYNHPGLLCATTMEVKGLPDGELVYFPVQNHGKAAPVASLALDGQTIPLNKEPDISNAKGYYYFTYPYDKAKHGQKQMLTLSFETEDGQHDTHQYVLVHGHRILMRIDPPLP